MKAVKRLAIGLFATALLCLSTSSVLAVAPTVQGFSSPVVIENDITFSAITNINFGTIIAPTTGVKDFIVNKDTGVGTVTLDGAGGTGGSFSVPPAAGTFTVTAGSADLVFLTWTPDLPGSVSKFCVTNSGSGSTAPEMRNLTLGQTNWETPSGGVDTSGGAISSMGATLTVVADAQGGWDCTFDVSADF